jgi:hypothetical protein
MTLITDIGFEHQGIVFGPDDQKAGICNQGVTLNNRTSHYPAAKAMGESLPRLAFYFSRVLALETSFTAFSGVA